MCHFPMNRPPPLSPLPRCWGCDIHLVANSGEPAIQPASGNTARQHIGLPKRVRPLSADWVTRGVLFIPFPSFCFLLTGSQRPRGTCVMSSSQQGKWSVVPVSVWGEGEGCCLALAASSFLDVLLQKAPFPPCFRQDGPTQRSRPENTRFSYRCYLCRVDVLGPRHQVTRHAARRVGSCTM